MDAKPQARADTTDVDPASTRVIRVPRRTNLVMVCFLAMTALCAGVLVASIVQVCDDLETAHRCDTYLEEVKQWEAEVRRQHPQLFDANPSSRVMEFGRCGLSPDPPAVVSQRCREAAHRGALVIAADSVLGLLLGVLAIRAARLRIQVGNDRLRCFGLGANVTLIWAEIDRFVSGARARSQGTGPYALLKNGHCVDLLGSWMPKQASDHIVEALVEAHREHPTGGLG